MKERFEALEVEIIRFDEEERMVNANTYGNTETND